MASKQVVALANRIYKEFGINADPEKFYRTYAGKWQRDAGAYSWIMYLATDTGIVGGCEPVRKYTVKKNRLEFNERSFNNFEIFVYSPDESGYNKTNCVSENKKEETYEVDIDFSKKYETRKEI